MNILVIRDDKPGHYTQSDGLVLSLMELFPTAKVEYIEVEIKNKISRKLLRFLLNKTTNFFKIKSNLKYLKYFYKKYSLPLNAPEIIVSTGGNTSNFNVWLAKAYGSKNILNGGLRGLGSSLFTCITSVIDTGCSNQIVIDTGPNTMTMESLQNAALKYAKKENLNLRKEYYTLLIGGDGNGYRYDKQFYNNLIEFIERISKIENIFWLITTSRRTPLKYESMMKENLKKENIIFIDYNENPQKVMHSFLGISKKIFVTEESSSMISEAISANKPVYTIGTTMANIDDKFFLVLKKYVDNKKIQRIKLDKYELMDDFCIDAIDHYKNISNLLRPIFLKGTQQ